MLFGLETSFFRSGQPLPAQLSGRWIKDEEVHVMPVTETILGSLFQAIKKLIEGMEKSRSREVPAQQTRDPKSG